MSTVVEHKKFSLTNLGNNNNKFWNVTLYDNGDVISEWGRQGLTKQSKTWPGAGRGFMVKKISEKEKKGYRENKVLEGSGEISISARSVANTELKDIASKQIKSKNPIVNKLIDFLVKENAHQILQATGGKITFDTSSATFKTTQGVVIPEQVARARDLLVELSDGVNKKDWDEYYFEDTLNEYLSIIPRGFGMGRRTPQSILPDLSAVQKENDILDGLDASFAGLQTAPKKKTKKKTAPKIFDVKMELIDEKDIVFGTIKRYYEKTKKTMHQSYRYKLKKVYKVEIADDITSFESKGKKIGNIMELFHGTKCSNCLSILRQGLIIPPSSAAHCTGRMYGNGVYASDISSKALNYATNFWGHGGSTARIFMFLVDFAMGKVYYPDGSYVSYPPRGYDSTFAKAGRSGVYNNEMIVYDTSQVRLKYLLEFE